MYRPYAVMLPACMGGGCSIRMNCARYHAADKRQPSERLCAPRLYDAWQPITVSPEHPAHHHTHPAVHGLVEDVRG